MTIDKSIYMTIGIGVGFISAVARLSLMGWLFMLGLITVVLFGIIHMLFLNQTLDRFDQMDSLEKKIAWIGVLSFPLIFLFQFDFGDSAGSFYTYEYVTGKNNWDFERYAYYLAIAGGLIYLLNFAIWRIKIKKL